MKLRWYHIPLLALAGAIAWLQSLPTLLRGKPVDPETISRWTETKWQDFIDAEERESLVEK